MTSWLVDQPALDRVTAVAMFLYRSNGVRRLTGQDVEYVMKGEQQQWEDLIDRLCELDGTRMLPDHGIGMGTEWETARVDALERLTGNARVPRRILERPIDRQTATMPYIDIGEGELASAAYIRKEMPYLLG